MLPPWLAEGRSDHLGWAEKRPVRTLDTRRRGVLLDVLELVFPKLELLVSFSTTGQLPLAFVADSSSSRLLPSKVEPISSPLPRPARLAARAAVRRSALASRATSLSGSESYTRS